MLVPTNWPLALETETALPSARLEPAAAAGAPCRAGSRTANSGRSASAAVRTRRAPCFVSVPGLVLVLIILRPRRDGPAEDGWAPGGRDVGTGTTPLHRREMWNRPGQIPAT